MIHNVRLTHKEAGTDKIPKAASVLKDFVLSRSIRDYVLIQTCNRAELYYTGPAKSPPDGFVYENGLGAFKHLLRVACGLESFVVGETEILHQIKQALRSALEEGHCSKELARHFAEAIRVGRKVRKTTKISAGKVSVVSLAIDYVRDLIGDLEGKRILVVGAGETGRKAAKALRNMNADKIFISNRNYQKALRLAREVGGSAHRLSALSDLVSGADLIFCATSAPHPIVTKEKIGAAKHELVIVDLSIPHNVEDSVRELGVRLITLEELSEKARTNLEKRIKEVKKVERTIDAELRNKGREEDLRKLYVHAEETRKKEVEKALQYLRTRPPERVIEDMSKSLVKKLFHPLRENSKQMENDCARSETDGR